jgi:High potential iron-sulfur protein
MHIDRMTISRRWLLRNIGFAAAAGIATTAPCKKTFADAEPPHLDVKDPAASALGYVEHTSEVDRKKYPEYVDGSSCENCLQLQGSPGNNYRPCTLFPGKGVSVSGWCKGWTAEM